MSNVKIPIAICAVVSEVLGGSHPTLEALFLASGAPGPPPDLSHATKWKTWLQQVGNDPEVDSLVVLGNLIEEFMDLPPEASDIDSDFSKFLPDPLVIYNRKKARLTEVLEEFGFRYYRGGRVLPTGTSADQIPVVEGGESQAKPSKIEDLLKTLIKGLPRAMHPLANRRKDAISLTFNSEYDIQDLIHSQLMPWIADIRPEEFTPSYAGSSTRMDFLLPVYSIVLEIKRVRDKAHGSKVGDELIIDIEHYRRHDKCKHLWCVVYDPGHFLSNPSGLISDLEGPRSMPEGQVEVKVLIF
jgi:hypothetical protein